MRIVFVALTLLVGLMALPVALPSVALSATPAPLATLPPEITHVVSRPLCTALRKRIAPSIGMMLQNDQTIGKGPQLFTDYNFAYGNKEEGRRNITLLRMENLVSPLANNIIAIKKQLTDKDLFPDHPESVDQQEAVVLKQQLLKALAAQEAALDIINGFVDTQQMADLQHADEGLIKQITTPGDLASQNSQATPDPMLHDPNYAGLTPNSYYINPATIPGLTLGYNPVTRLNDALQWTRKETTKRENVAARNVDRVIHICGGLVPGPAPTPTP